MPTARFIKYRVKVSRSQGSDDSVRATRDPVASKRALLDAAIALFAEFGPKSVPVRAIAKRAGVNHGLVHHYFGSKAGLVRAVLEDLSATTGLSIDRAGLRGFGASFLEGGVEAQTHLKVLARVVLDDELPEGYGAAFPLVGRLSGVGQDLYGLDRDTANIRALQAAAMIIGWTLFESLLVGAGGFDESRTAELRARLPEGLVKLAVPISEEIPT